MKFKSIISILFASVTLNAIASTDKFIYCPAPGDVSQSNLLLWAYNDDGKYFSNYSGSTCSYCTGYTHYPVLLLKEATFYDSEISTLYCAYATLSGWDGEDAVNEIHFLHNRKDY